MGENWGLNLILAKEGLKPNIVRVDARPTPTRYCNIKYKNSVLVFSSFFLVALLLLLLVLFLLLSLGLG